METFSDQIVLEASGSANDTKTYRHIFTNSGHHEMELSVAGGPSETFVWEPSFGAGDGIEAWPKDDRIVTYCGCPHHLSSIRAAGLQKAGFSEVYVIDEGFGVWAERGYPMSGLRSTTQSDISERVIEGKLDARYAGEYVWATLDRQYEAAPIQKDGRFTLVLKFSGLTDETPIRLSTPAYTVTRSLGQLISGATNG